MSINSNALEMNGKQGVSDKCVQSMDTTSDSKRECSDNALINSDYNGVIMATIVSLVTPHASIASFTKYGPKERQLVSDNNLKVIKTKFSEYEVEILRKQLQKFCDEFNCDEDMKTRL